MIKVTISIFDIPGGDTAMDYVPCLTSVSSASDSEKQVVQALGVLIQKHMVKDMGTPGALFVGEDADVAADEITRRINNQN
jgi:hypothetical protein